MPYFLVTKKGATSPAPALIHAYGGFRNAQTPTYLTDQPYRAGPLGLFWVEQGNAFVLADDLVEPFRPLVDALVVAMVAQGLDTLDPRLKRQFARLIAFDLRIGGEASPMSIAAVRLAQSLARAFETGRPSLAIFDPPTPIEWAALARIDEGGAIE